MSETSLRARSVALDPTVPFDAVALAGDQGIVMVDAEASFAGLGTALTLTLEEGLEGPGGSRRVLQALAAIEHDGPPPTRVRAFGALPFDRRAAGSLVVPAVTFSRIVEPDGGVHQWATLVGPSPGPTGADIERALADFVAPSQRIRAPGPAGPAITSVSPVPTPELYSDAVAKALTGIEAGTFSKVVLGRRLDVTFAESPERETVLRRLQAAEPLCTTFAFPLGSGGHFFGATPELLVARQGSTVHCHPLAGTVGLGAVGGDDAAVARFLASAKDRAEHQSVVDELLTALEPRCEELSAESEPTLVRLHSVAHLGTRLEGRLTGGGRAANVLELLADLHPTPAVGGVPRQAALQCIAELEPFSRELWAGPVGWVDASGDGRFMIAIRSASLNGTAARLWAGAGIVDGSQPEAELAETTVKLGPVLEALAPGTAG